MKKERTTLYSMQCTWSRPCSAQQLLLTKCRGFIQWEDASCGHCCPVLKLVSSHSGGGIHQSPAGVRQSPHRRPRADDGDREQWDSYTIRVRVECTTSSNEYAEKTLCKLLVNTNFKNSSQHKQKAALNGKKSVMGFLQESSLDGPRRSAGTFARRMRSGRGTRGGGRGRGAASRKKKWVK